jgi:hypothetical protein
MHSIKNISERNKIGTQSRADAKKPKKPTGLGFFFLNPGFFPTLPMRRARPRGDDVMQ